jgi:opacity protein-like surface antigen
VELDHDQIDLGFGIPIIGGGSVPGPAIESISRLKLRAGFDLGGVLAYGTIGVAHAKTNDFLDWKDGQVIGTGLSWMASPNWIVGAELLQQEFDGDGNTTSIEAML